MMRADAIAILAEHRGDAISVATMQSVVPWRDAEQGAKDHIDALGCMGSASSLGLGLALARPDRKVLVLDGDGSLLMQLGSLVTIAGAAPPNFYHVVFENGHYETSGNQQLPGTGRFGLCALARGAGYPRIESFENGESFRAALPNLLADSGPVFIHLAIEREDKPIRWPTVPMDKQVEELHASLAGSA